MNIYLVWRNFIKSAIYVTACISGHNWLDMSDWVLAQESVHLFYILQSDFKTINISVIIADTEHKIQLSGTGNYRGLK